MIPVEIVAAVSILYFGLLFAVAYYADKRREAGRSIISNSYIYSLSLAVYFTSWTFYGSVGRAAEMDESFRISTRQKLELQRYARVKHALEEGGWKKLKLRQLYHDRDEITVTGRCV